MGAAGAGTFEWAGNSAAVLRRRRGSGVRRVTAAVPRKGRGSGTGARAQTPGAAACLPPGGVRRVPTVPGSGPASPRKRCGGRLRVASPPGRLENPALGEGTGARGALERSVRRNRDREAEDLETRSERTCSARRATPPAAALTLPRSLFSRCQHCFQRPSREYCCHCLRGGTFS